MKIIKTYKIESSPLYGLKNKKRLATLFRIPLKQLIQFQSSNNYNTYPLNQKNRIREIQEPKTRLKCVQKRFKVLLQRIETPDWLISGKRGNSFVTNAQQHLNSKHFLTVDIESFYKNSEKEYIFRFFHYNMKMSEDVAWLLTDLVVYENLIPTGSPSSQVIAYWAYSDTFNNIKAIADNYHCTFSVYVDDLTFSSKQPISRRLPYLINNELNKVSHKIKNKKTTFFYPYQHKIITGCCIPPRGSLKVPNKLRYKIKQEEKVCLKDQSKKQNRLLGLILAARQIEPNIYKEKYNTLRKQYFK